MPCDIRYQQPVKGMGVNGVLAGCAVRISKLSKRSAKLAVRFLFIISTLHTWVEHAACVAALGNKLL